MLKKIFVPLAAAAILVLGALPASAQAGASASIGGVSNGQTITGCTTVRGNGSAGSGVKRLEIFINGNSVKSNSWGGIQTTQSIDYGWCTGGGRNGEYAIKVVATSQTGGSAEANARVKVDNAPAAPTGVAVSHSDGVVNISWNSNSEPDITGYRIERDSGSGWNSLGITSATGSRDTPGAGDHSYRVVALRYSPNSSSGKASSPSGSASINVPQPPPPTTDGGTGSEPGSGSDSGSEGSGSGSGSGGSGSGGSGVPGYGGSGGKKKGGSGSSGGGDVSVPGFGPQGGSFTVGGKTLGGIGLPGALSLPGGRGLPDLPSASGNSGSLADGTFEETLPYDLEGAASTEILGEGGPGNIAAVSTAWSVVPPDGLRWVAAGLWFLVTAALLRFLERRLAARERLETAAALEASGETNKPADAPRTDDGDASGADETAAATAAASEVDAERARCAATTKAGSPCRNYAKTSGYCNKHLNAAGVEQEEPATLRLVKEEDAA